MYQSYLPFVLPTASSASPHTSPLPAALSGARPTISKWRNYFIMNTQILLRKKDYPKIMRLKIFTVLFSSKSKCLLYYALYNSINQTFSYIPLQMSPMHQ